MFYNKLGLLERGNFSLVVYDHVGPSSVHANLFVLELAIEEARERGAILVAAHRDRFIRSSSFDGRTRTELPTIGEYMQLRRMAGNVPLATIHHPDEPARSNQIKRGQGAKGNKGERPLKTKPGYKRKRREELQPLAIQMRQKGLSLRSIEKTLSVRHSTIQGWVSGVRFLCDAPS